MTDPCVPPEGTSRNAIERCIDAADWCWNAKEADSVVEEARTEIAALRAENERLRVFRALMEEAATSEDSELIMTAAEWIKDCDDEIASRTALKGEPGGRH